MQTVVVKVRWILECVVELQPDRVAGMCFDRRPRHLAIEGHPDRFAATQREARTCGREFHVNHTSRAREMAWTRFRHDDLSG